MNPEDGTRSGQDATRHTLRHTYATEQLEAGLTIAEIADLLGHASTTTTERYAHRRGKVRPEAADTIRDPRQAPPTPAPEPPIAEHEELPSNVVRGRFGA